MILFKSFRNEPVANLFVIHSGNEEGGIRDVNGRSYFLGEVPEVWRPILLRQRAAESEDQVEVSFLPK